MDAIPTREAAGRKLYGVYMDDKWELHKPAPAVIIPDDRHLMNFKVTAGPRTLIVLDPYGNEIIGPEANRRIFRDSDYTIAVDCETGAILLANFYIEKKHTVLVVSEFPALKEPSVIPKHYLPRLPELLSKKRPFHTLFMAHAMLGFIEQETGFMELAQSITFFFDFDKRNLEVAGTDYREVSDWQST